MRARRPHRGQLNQNRSPPYCGVVSVSGTRKRLPYQSITMCSSSRWARPPGSHKNQPWDFMARKSTSTTCVVRRLCDDLATIAL